MATTGTQTHNLKADGAPFNTDGTPVHADKSTKGSGAFKCSCGYLSGTLNSRGERQKAHKDHKAGVDPELQAELDLIVGEPTADTVSRISFPNAMPKRWHGALVNGARTVVNLAFPTVYVADDAEGVELTGEAAAVTAASQAVEHMFAGAWDALFSFTRTDEGYINTPKVNREDRKELKDMKRHFLHTYAVAAAKAAR